MTDHYVRQDDRTSPLTSMSLLDQAQAQDEEAWKRIHELYHPLVYKWCRRRGLGEAATNDVGQEVFTSVFKFLDQFEKVKAGQTFRAWLRTITENKVTDHLRRESLQPNLIDGGDSGSPIEQLAVASVDFDSRLEEEERSERVLLLRRCLDMVCSEFEPKTWDAFWKTAVEEIPPADVAETLGLSRNAVYLARSRVLNRLSELFDRLLEDFSTLH